MEQYKKYIILLNERRKIMEKILEVKNIEKYYGGKVILQRLLIILVLV